MRLQTDVKAGQIWGDKDKRRQGRQIRVEQISDGIAQCSIRQSEESEFSQRLTRISLDRFSRYQLIKDAEQGASESGAAAATTSPASEDVTETLVA